MLKLSFLPPVEPGGISTSKDSNAKGRSLEKAPPFCFDASAAKPHGLAAIRLQGLFFPQNALPQRATDLLWRNYLLFCFRINCFGRERTCIREPVSGYSRNAGSPNVSGNGPCRNRRNGRSLQSSGAPATVLVGFTPCDPAGRQTK